MTNSYKPGDIVRLKTGGPKMTVKSVDTHSLKETIWCQWFAGSSLKGGQFVAESLVAVEDESDGK